MRAMAGGYADHRGMNAHDPAQDSVRAKMQEQYVGRLADMWGAFVTA